MKIEEIIKIPSLVDQIALSDYLEEALVIRKQFLDTNKNIIIVKSNIYQARKLYHELRFLMDEDDLLIYGFDESIVVETIAASSDLAFQRLESIVLLKSKKPRIIITHTLAIIKPIMQRDNFYQSIITLNNNSSFNFDNFIIKLKQLGYLKVPRVTQPFEYAVRGSVIDVYSIINDMPLRIDSFDNEIDSIKYFDVQSQRSRISLDSALIYPTSIYDSTLIPELLEKINEKTENIKVRDDASTFSIINPEAFLSRYYNLNHEVSSICDYINDYQIITSSYNDITNTFKVLNDEAYEYLNSLVLEDKAIVNYELYLDMNDYVKDNLDIKSFQDKMEQQTFNLFQIEPLKKPDQFIKSIEEYQKAGYMIYLFLTKEREIKIINNLLTTHNLNSPYLVMVKEELSRGFVSNDDKVVVYTKKEIFNENKRKNNFINKYQNSVDINELDDLKVDDFIVHKVHGIGQYLGLIKLKVDNIEKDFLHISYKDNEKLYIPIDQFNLIKKYSSSEGHVPKISRLGGSDWKKTKIRVKQKIEDMMDELLELYAIRQKPIGYSFDKDNDIQKEFESDFEYNLTDDQEKAINDVKKDMESNEVMDRLICGDVGYGKTEVAIRAIMKAVLSNKQVVFLCPTTILARQHYQTLLERFTSYPVNIVQVSRHTTAAVFTQINTAITAHKIDVVVGTHKVLSNKITFSDLGLLVVDEEQRFGVKDKEKIKQLKQNVDVLTLSATPIPRTLQMSLTGLRKMSLLQTPPVNRMPIQTYVVEKNQFLIKEVIERELSRNGQVFYLHNKTSDIERVAQDLEAMFTDAKVGVIHGKMNKSLIEQVMINFDQNIYNILVCTTIIETGIDIPNANTIIIEDANNFGLAQLYQIKGRVGRSNRLAYAYLMFKKNKVMNEDATKRLQAIKELTKLGSGYKIAMRDLAIRGAGDILGKTQAGNIDNVGYDMYLELLQEVMDQRQNIVKVDNEVEIINIKNTGFIPADYKLDDNNKINLYQKIYNVKEVKEFKQLINELEETHGKLPIEIKDIINKRKFELLVNEISNIRVIDEPKKINIQLNTNVNNKNKVKEIFACCDEFGAMVAIEIKYQKIHLVFSKYKGYLQTVNEVLESLKEILNEQ